MNIFKRIIIIIPLLIGLVSLCSAQSIIKIKKTTWYVNGVKKNGGGEFWGISFVRPYVYFYVTKSNNEKGTVKYKMDSSAGGIFLGHDYMDIETKIIINTEIPASAAVRTYTVTLTNGTTSAKAILELE